MAIDKREFIKNTSVWRVLIFCILFAHGCTTETSNIQAQKALPQTIDHIESSVVQISFHASDMPPELVKKLDRPLLSIPIGTGFVVSADGYIITASHVAKEGLELLKNFPAKRKELRVAFAMKNREFGVGGLMMGNFELGDFNLVGQDEENDLALLKVSLDSVRRNPLVSVGPVRFNVARPKAGQSIAVSGYPFESPVLLTNLGVIATPWTSTGIIDRKQRASFDRYLGDITVNAGNSGGPVYFAETGAVVGICIAYLNAPAMDRNNNQLDTRYNARIAIIVPSKYAIALLNKHKVNWLEALSK